MQYKACAIVIKNKYVDLCILLYIYYIGVTRYHDQLIDIAVRRFLTPFVDSTLTRTLY